MTSRRHENLPPAGRAKILKWQDPRLPAAICWGESTLRASDASASLQRLNIEVQLPPVEAACISLPQLRATAELRFAACDSAQGLTAVDRAGQGDTASATAAASCPGARRRTRVRPPRDVVRLSDRLAYVLQPPLENLLSAAALEFPFHPFPFQLDGIAFLYPRHEAVVADEMGLGKTMQAVVALRLLAREGAVRRALVLCPKPLLTNWQRELRTWAPELPVTAVSGGSTRRHWIWQNAVEGVLLANYESLVRDADAAAGVDPPFDLVIIDEAQRIKNRRSATNQAVCGVARKRSWALTGTPIENSQEDLTGIFEYVSPGQLRPKMSTAAVRTAVADHVIRRTKDQVLAELPPKMIRDAEITLTPEQLDAYRRAEEDGVVQLDNLGAQLTVHHVFDLILRLKQICNFDPATGESAKLACLDTDLEECVASGRKAIVFSQWVATIECLARRLAHLKPLEYHGKIAMRRRDAIIEEFQHDPRRPVLLMSYGAGSVGLNLQFAQYVFLFDRWWNPAVEDQAINRAHRIGAAGPVTVTRFVCQGTIEERIDGILREKRELFDEVFGDGTAPRQQGMTRDEIFSLFPLKFPSAAGFGGRECVGPSKN